MTWYCLNVYKYSKHFCYSPRVCFVQVFMAFTKLFHVKVNLGSNVLESLYLNTTSFYRVEFWTKSTLFCVVNGNLIFLNTILNTSLKIRAFFSGPLSLQFYKNEKRLFAITNFSLAFIEILNRSQN